MKINKQKVLCFLLVAVVTLLSFMTPLPNVSANPTSEIHLTASQEFGAQGETVFVDIDLTRNTLGVTTMHYYVGFDATRLELVAVHNTGLLPLTPPNINNNPVSLLQNNGLAGMISTQNATLVRMEFRIRPTAPVGAANVTISNYMAGGNHPTTQLPVPRTMTVANGSVTVRAGEPDLSQIHLTASQETGAQGETVFVSVDLARNTDGVTTMHYYVGFDATRLELVAVHNSGLLPLTPPNINNNPVSLLQNNGLAGMISAQNATLVELEFRIRPTAPLGAANITFSNYMAGGNHPVTQLPAPRTMTVANGSVTVTEGNPDLSEVHLTASQETGAQGETVFVSIDLARNTAGVTTMHYYVGFDATRLELVAVHNEGLLPLTPPNVNNNPVSLLQNNGLAGMISTQGATLVELEFRILPTAPLGAANITISNYMAGGNHPVTQLPVPRTMTVANGSVTVTEGTDLSEILLTASQETGAQGETVFVTVDLTRNTLGVTTMHYYVGFDATRLELVAVHNEGLLPLTPPNVNNNPVSLLQNNGLAGMISTQGATLVELEFRIRPTAPLGVANITISNYMAGGNHPVTQLPVPRTITVANGSVTVTEPGDSEIHLTASEETGTRGETVFVTVDLARNTDGVTTMHYYVGFDATRLELVAIHNEGLLPLTPPNINNNPVSLLQNNGLAGMIFDQGETLVELEFRILPTAPLGAAHVTFTSYMAGGNHPTTQLPVPRTITVANGSVTVVDGGTPPPGDRIPVANNVIISRGSADELVSYNHIYEGNLIVFDITVRVPPANSANAYNARLFMCFPAIFANPTLGQYATYFNTISGVLDTERVLGAASIHPTLDEVVVPLGDLELGAYLAFTLTMEATEDALHGHYNLLRFFSVVHD